MDRHLGAWRDGDPEAADDPGALAVQQRQRLARLHGPRIAVAAVPVPTAFVLGRAVARQHQRPERAQLPHRVADPVRGLPCQRTAARKPPQSDKRRCRRCKASRAT